MARKIRGVIPKSAWPPGPWHNEPDAMDWPDARTGLQCSIRRNLSLTGTLNGYVGVPVGHTFYGWRHDDHIALRPEDSEGSLDDVDVIQAFIYALQGGSENGTIPLGMALKTHRGIGWSGESMQGQASGLWWFGFDTGHAGDYWPAMDALMISIGHRMPAVARGTYRNIEYVKKEVTNLAFQLKQLETRVISESVSLDKFTKT